MPAPTESRLDSSAEVRTAGWLAALVLLTLTLVKPLGGIAYVGAVAFTLAAGMQLYLPVWRAERFGLRLDAVGLHTRAWRKDLRIVGYLSLLTFPIFAVGHHVYMTQAHDWSRALGWEWLAVLLPRGQLAPHLPDSLWKWLEGSYWFLEICAVNILGVALPEETFYRGYLQPRLERRWPPARQVFGVPIGRAALLTAVLFAAGHFLGEWNVLRLGPFFPALIFAWQRNATGSVLGAVLFHGLCNISGVLLFSLYAPA